MKFILLCNTGTDDSSSNSFKPAIKILMRMKLMILLLTVACSQAWSNGYSQTITLNLKNASLETAFSEIRKQSPYRFIYTKEDLTGSKMINIDLKDVPIKEVMEQCLVNQPLTYQIEGLHIIIRKRKNEMSGIDEKPVIAVIDVTGEVLNADGEAVVGASVQVKGNENKGTSTDANGLFILRQIDDKAILIISSTNIETHEIKVNGKSNLGIITVKTRVSKLDEVQIIGYGTNTQRFNVGSVTKITAEEIGKQPVSNPLAALQGRVPGLVVTSTSGLPGASFNIQIRGQNSLDPEPGGIQPLDNPLFIINGVPFAPQNNNLNQFRSVVSPGLNATMNNFYGGISPFNNINPADIESIEVLRDADATAIYGSRGANGVILITTKKGKTGKTGVNFNIYTGANFLPSFISMMDTEDYITMRKEAFANDGIIPGNSPSNSTSYAPDLTLFDTTKYTDWQDEFIGFANTIDANVSISGGNETTQFLIGGGFRKETNVYRDDFSNHRASVNFNINNISTNQKFIVNLSSNYSFSENEYSSGGTATPNLMMVYSLPPNYPDLLNSKGDIIWDYKGVSLGGTGITHNPASHLLKRYLMKTSNLISNLQLSYKLPYGLTIRSNFGYNFLISNEYSGYPSSAFDPDRSIDASADFGNRNINSWIIEPQMEWSKLIGKNKLNILIGSTIQQDNSYSTITNASGYPNDALIESISGALEKVVEDRYSTYKYNALFGRLNFIHDKKYIINLTGRRDGSSRFGPGKQFGNFGSLATGWIFSEEPWISKTFSFLSFGKLRISYGITGNDNIGDYQYISRWGTTLYSYQGSVGYTSQNLYNPDFSWGTTKKLESGLEIGLLKDKILLNGTWFRNRSGNQLVSYPLPSQSGFSNIIENLPALVENKGWEFQVTTNNYKSNKFSWLTSFNFTFQKNKLLSFPEIENSSYAGNYIVGEPISVLTKFEYINVNPNNGIFQFLSAQGDTTHSPIDKNGSNLNDKKVVGSKDPKFFGGMNNNITFKNFDLNIFLEFKKQIGENYLAQFYQGYFPGYQFNLPDQFKERWQKPGDIVNLQKVSVVSYSAASQAARKFYESTGIIGDASFIRLKNVSLTYSFHDKTLKKLKLSGLKLYLNAQNLYTITKLEVNDPETQSFYAIPPLKSFTAGFQIMF